MPDDAPEPPAPDFAVIQDGEAVHVRFDRQAFASAQQLGCGLWTLVPVGLVVAGVLDFVAGPKPNPCAGCVLGCMGSLLAYGFVGVMWGAVRSFVPAWVTVDPAVGECVIRPLPWREYRLPLAAVRRVDVLYGQSNGGPWFWLTVTANGFARPIPLRQYSGYNPALQQARVTQAAEALAAVLGVPSEQRGMSYWEAFTTW